MTVNKSFTINIVNLYEQIGANINGSGSNEGFGDRVSLNQDGTIIALGRPTYGFNNSQGLVETYQYSSGSWNLIGGGVTWAMGPWYDYSGSSVALNADGTRIAVGTRGARDGQRNAGGMKVYELTGPNWTQLGTTLEGSLSGDLCGVRVALNDAGDIAAMSCPTNSSGRGLQEFINTMASHGRLWVPI